MRNKGLSKLTERLGIALIAPKSAGRDWTIPGAPQHSTIAGVDELVHFDHLIEDVLRWFPIDKNNTKPQNYLFIGLRKPLSLQHGAIVSTD